MRGNRLAYMLTIDYTLILELTMEHSLPVPVNLQEAMSHNSLLVDECDMSFLIVYGSFS